MILAVGFTTVAVASALNSVAAAGPTPAAAGEFVPLAPATLVDTTTGIGWSGKLQPDATHSVKVSTTASAVPARDVSAVMLHISTSGSALPGVNSNGNVWAWPAGAARPEYAIVANPPAGSVADNTAIVEVGGTGQVSFHNGAAGTAVDLSVDIVGYVTSRATAAAGATFAPLAPSRIIDTSDGTGGRSTPLTSAQAWTFPALGTGGIPRSGVSALALNVGAGATSTNCWVQVQPTGTEASHARYPRIDTYANYTAQGLAVVAPDAAGDLTFSTTCASADIFADVEGYYLAAADGSSADVYVPITNPTRVIDTRHDVGVTGKITAGRVVSGSRAVAVTGVGGVPANADTVALSIGTINADALGYNTIWTDGTARPTSGTIDTDPNTVESNLAFVQTGVHGKIDVAGVSSDPSMSNDLYADIEGYFYHSSATDSPFGTPRYYPSLWGDTFFNTVGSSGDILATGNDTHGLDSSCTTAGSDVGIFDVKGANSASLTLSTVNCMTSYGHINDPGAPDGCTWKSGGITRIGRTVYLSVARQLKACSDGKETNGLQPSSNASIVKSTDDGKTWTNPWGTTSSDGAAPPWNSKLHRYQAMFPGQAFPAPFFIQYGPGNTQTVDGGGRYLYAVSTDGYAYNGNYIHLARVPLSKIETSSAWQFYHGPVGGTGQKWTNSPAGATRVLQARHALSQPAIQYVPALKRYVLTTFFFSRAGSDFPTLRQTPYSRFQFYTAPKPWGPWTHVFDHGTQRNLWCTASPCPLVQQPGSTVLDVGKPDDWLGFYDPALVQKFVFTRPLSHQALLTCGDWKNRYRYPGEIMYRLHVVPFDLSAVLRP